MKRLVSVRGGWLVIRLGRLHLYWERGRLVPLFHIFTKET